MGAFLRECPCWPQPAYAVAINPAEGINYLLGIILRDDRSRFLFALRAFEAEKAKALCCFAYRLLIHWSHRLCHERLRRLFGDCRRRLFLNWLSQFLRDNRHPLFRDRAHRLIRFLHRFTGDDLHHVVCGSLLIVARKIQRCWSQSLRAKSSSGSDDKRCSCECQKGRSFPHGGEVMLGIATLGKLFFEKISLTEPAAIRGTPRVPVSC